MSYELSDTERNAALQLNADYRYEHFISKLVEHEELFILTDEHGVMMLTTDDEDCIPVWPHPEYAKAWAEGEWAQCKPQSITLKVWLEKWIDGMEQDEAVCCRVPDPGSGRYRAGAGRRGRRHCREAGQARLITALFATPVANKDPAIWRGLCFRSVCQMSCHYQGWR